MKKQSNQPNRQILGRVKRDEFVGRSAELEQLAAHAGGDGGGLLIMLSPLAGVSELLRQTFDSLFDRRDDVVPIYFALPPAETTPVSAAIEFLNTFLAQYLAFRRDEPSLCQTSLTLDDLLRLAPSSDLGWIEELVGAYHRQRFGEDDRDLVRLCLTAPARVPTNLGRTFVMFDAVQLANFDSPFAVEIVKALQAGANPFVLAGLRRGIVDAIERAGAAVDSFVTMRLEQFADDDARRLVTSAAQRCQVSITDETRDLLVQQLEGSPFFIMSLLQAARERQVSLDSYLACERLYVDELMGGRLHRSFSAVLENIAPEPETRAAIVRLLCEATTGRHNTVPVASWRRRLEDVADFEDLLRRLHLQELINWDGETIDPTGNSAVWKDFLTSRFRLDSLREPRALVVADVMADALKRAPQTIARHYRRTASLRLRELVDQFNSQLVPKVLFDYSTFADTHKGATMEEIATQLDADQNLLRLPQVFHIASGHSFGRVLNEVSEESTAVAHAFDGSAYTDANEIVWLVGKLESKLEASLNLVQQWLKRFDDLSRQSGFVRTQVWLISDEGFSPAAIELLREREAYGSSRQQFELLTMRLSNLEAQPPLSSEDEFTLVVPMGADNELLAAMTVEQVARRINFSREAINQIKTAVVEACINASEHSLSPDRKIYQRFRVEDDKLTVTISSRGVLPVNISEKLQTESADKGSEAATDERRGWGLKLIKTLMDEVEFERVDEGTSLRMTKYLRKTN